jgi:hypothetical protein
VRQARGMASFISFSPRSENTVYSVKACVRAIR